MATAIPMPALSPTMKEGKITKWLKQEGEKIASGQPIAECETDKANLEIESYEDGVLLKVLVKEGESAPVGAAIAMVGKKGEAIEVKPASPPSAPSPNGAAQGAPAAAAPGAQVLAMRPVASSAPVAAPSAPAAGSGRLRISPLARRMAKESGVELSALQGSGPSGRIVKRDVVAVLERPASARPAAPAARAPAFQAPSAAPVMAPLSSMRKVIAQRMAEAKHGVPHFYLNVDVDMGEALKLKDEAKAQDVKVSVNDIILKATAVALRRMPAMNVQFGGDSAVKLSSVDVGMAVAIEDGLLTPVLRNADSLSLSEIASLSRELAERARRRALKPEEYTGGSITVSNLGMFGIDSFTAIINSPQAAILAVGTVADKVVARGGQPAVRPMMTVTFSGDHRIIDGALGAQYLQVLKGLLEHPLRLLM